MSSAGAARGTDRAFVTDFGLARDTATGSRFTRTGATLGTLAYMPPEQARGELALMTSASDVWALGCVLYEVTTGRRAFEGESAADVVAAVLTREPAPLRALRPHVPAGVERLVRACLAKPPGPRPANATALREDCDRVLRGVRPATRLPRRYRWAVAAAVLTVAGAAGAGRLLGVADGGPSVTLVSPAMAEADALARRAHELRQSDPRGAARLLGDALALHERERPADEAGRAAWRLERGLLLWATGRGPEARAEWGGVPPSAREAVQARLYRGFEAVCRVAGETGMADLEGVADGTGPEARLARGTIAALSGRWATARTLLAGLDGWEAALQRGYIEAHDPGGDPAASVREYTKAFEQGLTFAWALSNRGLARAAQGDLAGAIADYDRAVSIEPALAGAYVNRAGARDAQGDSAGALADLERAMELHPGHAMAHYNRGNLRRAGGDLAGAVADYTQAIATDPRHVLALINRGLERAAQGDLVGAIADYDRALVVDPTHKKAYQNRANARRAQGDFTGALADYDRALELDPRYAKAHFGRGIARSALGDLHGAIEDYDRALAIDPNDAESWNNRGVARVQQGRLADAILDYARALAVAPPEWRHRRMVEENLDSARAALAARGR